MIANFIDSYNIINIIPLNLHRHGRKVDKIISDNNDLVSKFIISKSITEPAAGGFAFQAVSIAKFIGSRGSQHSNINNHFTILNRLITTTMRAEYARAFHVALGSKFSQRAIHTAFN